MTTTADTLPPDTMRTATGRAVPVRWTQRRRDIFNFIRPVSVSLVATDGPVSLTLSEPGGEVRERIGHNRAVWPARIVKGSAARDAATTTWNKFPLVFFGTQARLWCLHTIDRDRLANHLVDLLALKAERAASEGGQGALPHGCADIGPDIDLSFLEMEMHGLAQSLGVWTWDDYGLIRWFDSIGRRFDALQAERPEIRWSERLISKLAARDLERREKRDDRALS